MSKIQTTGIIRERGQLTIPDSVRIARSWVSPSSVVVIISEKPDEIIIKPHAVEQTTNWKELWNSIHLVRSFKGKRGDLSSFVVEDRQSH